MPFAWGLWHPTILLPTEATTWPPEQMRSVLLHELAHIARWDYPVHLLIEIVRALYWINPLVTLAARRAAMERERACDDIALCHGTSSDAYALHLLDIARLQLQPLPAGATTMAGEPGLFERVRSVMNQGLNRSPVRLAGVLATAGFAFLVATPVATVDLLAVDQRWEPPAVGEAIEDLKDRSDPAAQRLAAYWLGQLDNESDGVLPLIDALQDPSGDVRLVACWALGEIKDARAIDPLVLTMERDSDRLVREMATLAAGEITRAGPIDALVRTFHREENLQRAAIWALGEIHDERAAQARRELIALLDQEPWCHQEVWCGDLGDLEVYATDPGQMLEQLGHGDANARRQAAWTLGMVGYLDTWSSWDQLCAAIDRLLDTLRDPVPEVRAMAVWSLDEINPSWSVRDWRRAAFPSIFHEHQLNALGNYLTLCDRYDLAIAVLRTNLGSHPRSATCHDRLGEAYWHAGRKGMAVEHFARSLELDPGNTHALKHLADWRKEQTGITEDG
jgi:HEAT repeat protein